MQKVYERIIRAPVSDVTVIELGEYMSRLRSVPDDQSILQGLPLKKAMAEFERFYLSRTMKICRGNRERLPGPWE